MVFPGTGEVRVQVAFETACWIRAHNNPLVLGLLEIANYAFGSDLVSARRRATRIPADYGEHDNSSYPLSTLITPISILIILKFLLLKSSIDTPKILPMISRISVSLYY